MRRGRYASPAALNLGLSAWRSASRNGNGVALSRRRYHSRNISGTAANITIINNKQGDTKIQKAVVTAVGFARVCLSVMPVRKRVFLLIVPTIPTVMHGMTTAATTVKKIGRWPFKKSAVGGTKTAAYRRPSQLSQGAGAHWKPLSCPPQGAGIHSCCVCGGCSSSHFSW